MDGWFPKIRPDGFITSGDGSIWITPLVGESYQVSSVGLAPFWVGRTLCYNRNDNSTQVGRDVITPAYNDYASSEVGQWAGFLGGAGRIDRYQILNGFYTHTARVIGSVVGGSAPRFLGGSLGYLFPYQANAESHYERTLFIDGIARDHGVLTDWVADRSGQCYISVKATGTYTKKLFDQEGNDITIRAQQDEGPIACFIGPDHQPWMAEGLAGITAVRNFYSAGGYTIPGELCFPDFRMIGARLMIAGSSSRGVLRVEWIDFTQPMQDLRLV